MADGELWGQRSSHGEKTCGRPHWEDAMALAQCWQCRGEVSMEAVSCPHCGAPRPNRFSASPRGPAEGSAFRKPPLPPRAHERKGEQPKRPALELCPAMKPLLSASPPVGVRRTPEAKRTPEANTGINAADNFRILWSCASNKITEAEESLAALSAATPRSLASLDLGDLPSVEGMRLEDVGDLFLNHPRWEFRREEEMVLKDQIIATLIRYPREPATESPYLLLFSVKGTKMSGDARLTRIGWTGRLEWVAREELSEKAGCRPR